MTTTERIQKMKNDMKAKKEALKKKEEQAEEEKK